MHMYMNKMKRESERRVRLTNESENERQKKKKQACMYKHSDNMSKNKLQYSRRICLTRSSL